MGGMMSESSKKGRKVVDRRTKAQLVQELAEAQATLQKQNLEIIVCGKDLQNAKIELKELQGLKTKLRSPKANLNKAKKVLDEKKDIENKLQEIEANAAIQIEEATINLREAEQENQNLKKEVEELKEQLEDYRKKIPIEDDRGEEIIRDITTSKSTFLIHLYPRQGDFQGRIEYPLTRDKKTFRGLDSEVVFKFISKHLPQPTEKEKMRLPTADADEKLSDAPEKKIPRGAKMRVSIRPKTMPPQVTKALKELKLQQMKRILEPGSVLQAYRPFALFTQLHFPVMPTANNLDIDTSNYEVLVILADAKKENVVARRGVADILSAQVADYENKINMPGLAPGKYWMKIHALAPYANIEESKEIDLKVQR